MKTYKQHILITLLIVILHPLLTFAEPRSEGQSYVLNALFANTENPYPIELWEDRDNEQINIFDIAREIKVIAGAKDDVLNLDNTKNSNDSDHAILLERLAQMKDIADRALLMEADKWKPDYVNELMKHIIGIRNAGISNLIPNEVNPNNCEKQETNNAAQEILEKLKKDLLISENSISKSENFISQYKTKALGKQDDVLLELENSLVKEKEELEQFKNIILIIETSLKKTTQTIASTLNQELENTDIINPCDKNGERWTSFARLAEPNDQEPSVANYMQSHGTDIELVKTWWGSQLSSSWDPGCAAVKAFYSNQRTLDPESYYWSSIGYYRETKDGYQTSQDEYSAFWQQGASCDNDMCYPTTTNKEEAYIKAFTIWHAYVQEVLAKTKFYHNRPDNKEICLIRTNGKKALKSNNITHFGKDNIIPSAAYDSFSLINIFGKGTEKMVITESLVPHHRIIHLYPLLGAITPGEREHQQKQMTQDVDWLINNYYDKNGSLTIDRENPSSVEKFIEAFIYREYSLDHNEILQKPFHRNGDVNWPTYWKWDDHAFDIIEEMTLQLLPILPEQLPSENTNETLVALIMRELSREIENNGYFRETEVVVLSGPDLPFDYFYNADDNLSHLEKRLNNGEGACGHWPALEDLKQIGHLGGSTGALLYQNPKTSKKYVLKKGASEGHIREEALADRLYDAMGFAIPESRLYESPEGPVKIATYLENSKSLRKAYYGASDAEKQRLRNEISKGFVIDALLANFDVVGLDMDNVLIGEDGQAYRVDNGASFRYRAMGKLKNDTPNKSRKRWNPSPISLWTLRDPAVNPNCAEIFADLTIYEIAEKIRSLMLSASETVYNQETKTYEAAGPIIETFLHHTVLTNAPEVKAQTEARFNNFKKVADKASAMQANGLTVAEAEMELRKWVESEDWGPAFE